MPNDFIPRTGEPDPKAGGSGDEFPPRVDVALDDLDHGAPNEAPKALMRKRYSIWIWILLALALGGFIALVMVMMSE
jgi:hypothetical protein